MPTQEVRASESTDMVVLHMTKKEAQFLRNRCYQARAVVYSNLREEFIRQGPRLAALQQEAKSIDDLIIKLTEAGAG